jgi:DNA-directed RNA polymerase subunit M/transcription elongation factor TFIIS
MQRPTREEMEVRVHEMVHGVTCDVCGKHFQSRTQLNVHALIHSAEAKKAKGIARLNGASAPGQHSAARRVEAPALCPACGEQLSTMTVLVKHYQRRHAAPDAALECAKCGKRFKTKSDLSRHEGLCLSGPDAGKVIRCTVCQMIQTTANAWREHSKQTKHRSCELCWPDGSSGGAAGAAGAVPSARAFGTVLDDDEIHAPGDEPASEDEAIVVHVGHLDAALEAHHPPSESLGGSRAKLARLE